MRLVCCRIRLAMGGMMRNPHLWCKDDHYSTSSTREFTAFWQEAATLNLADISLQNYYTVWY